jgi:hypothetical protein
MAEFNDIITTRVVVDGRQAINQLGLLEDEAKELRNSMKAANKETKEYTEQAAQMKGLESGLKRITNQMIKLKGEGKENTQRFKDLQMMSAMTSDAIAQLGAKMQSTQRFTKEYLEAAERLPEVENKIRKLKDSMGVAGMTTKQLRQEQKTLKAQFDNTLQGTEGYELLRKKLVEVGVELKKRNEDIAIFHKETSGFLGKIKNFGTIAAGNIAAQIVGNAASVISDFAVNLVEQSKKLSDQLTDIRKTTGMTAEEVTAFNQALTQIDTRTSTNDLREMAKVAGQIGIQKDEMLSFVKAIDVVNVALGDEFSGGVNEIVKSLGTMRTLFQETKDMDPGEAIMRIGSAVNELASSGMASAPFIADFTSRIGQLGRMAPTITQTMGLAAAFQELGLSAEIAAGGITNIMLNAGKESKAYAKQIGMTVEEFKNLLNTDPNEMFLRLANSMKGLESTDVAATMDRLKIGSQEAIKVMSLLSAKTDLVREKQELNAEAFQKNESVMTEFNLKLENFAGLMERASNKLTNFTQGVALGLTPAFTALLGFLLSTVDILIALPKFLKDNAQWFGVLAVAIVTLNFELIKQNALLIIDAAQTLIVAKSKAALAKATNIAKVAQAAFNFVLSANPIGLVVIAIAALVAGLYTLYQNSETVRKAIDSLFNGFKEIITVVIDFYAALMSLDFKKIADIFKNGGKQIGAAFTSGIKDGQSKAGKIENLDTNPFTKDINSLSNQAKSNKTMLLLEKEAQDKALIEANKARAAELNAQSNAEKAKKAAKEKAANDALERLRKANEDERKLAQENYKNRKEDLLLSITDEFERRRLAAQMQFEEEEIAINKSLAQAQTKNEALERLERKRVETLLAINNEERMFRNAEAEKALKEELARIEYENNLTYAAEEDAINRRYMLETASEKNAFLQKAAALYADQTLSKEELDAKLAELDNSNKMAELQREKAHLQDMLELKKKYGFETEQDVIETGIRILAIEKDIAAEQRRIQEDLVNAKKFAAGQISQVLGQTAAMASENAKFSKALTLAQIGIDTAMAISGSMKGAVAAANATGPAAPFTLIGYIASMIATVLGGFMSAKKAIAAAEVPAPPRAAALGSYKKGGFTGRAMSDNQVSGITHANEYVTPADMIRNSPLVASMTNLTETMRTGGNVENATLPGMNELTNLVGIMINKIDTLIQVTGMAQDKEVVFVWEKFKEFSDKEATIVDFGKL